jgi:hypothetical protein
MLIFPKGISFPGIRGIWESGKSGNPGNPGNEIPFGKISIVNECFIQKLALKS